MIGLGLANRCDMILHHEVTLCILGKRGAVKNDFLLRGEPFGFYSG